MRYEKNNQSNSDECFKEYRRFCKRCGNIYITLSKRSKICNKCKIKSGRRKVLIN